MPSSTTKPQTADASGIEKNANIEARIRNPLAGIPREQLLARVSAFALEKELYHHIAILRKGALVAQSPDHATPTITGNEALTEGEKAALQTELHHKWRLPWRLYLTIATCSIGAAVQGWDQTGVNGATVFFPDDYGIGSTSTKDSLLVGLVNAGPYIGSALLGCWLSDSLNNWAGRRGTIFLSAHFCIWPVIGSAFCQTWPQQLACRLLMGIGMGVKASTVPIYAAENSPAAIRGALVMSWQMWTAFGILLGGAFNLAVWNAKNNWRLMIGAPFIPAVPLLLLIYLCPESPRWLIKQNRYKEAWNSMAALRPHKLLVARDILRIYFELEVESEFSKNSSYGRRFGELFTVPRIRRATLAALTVMIAQQMCGINIIAFYSTTVFREAGFSLFDSLLGSFGFGVVNFLFSIPAFYTIDTFGRRSLLLFTFPQMTWTLLAAGLCTLLPPSTMRTVLVAFFVYLFGAFYSPGEGPVPFTYSAEVFPLSHREMGMGFVVAICLGLAAVLGMTFPFLLVKAGTVGAFACYAATNGVSFVKIFLFVRETKQKTLEELDGVFAVPMGVYIKYQVREVVPWWFKRWVLWQRSVELRPMVQEGEGLQLLPIKEGEFPLEVS